MLESTGFAGPSETDRVLLALCQRNRSADVLQAAAEACQVDWRREALLERAQDNRVTGLILKTLEVDGVLDRLPSEPAAELRAELKKLERVASFWSMERDRVRHLFARAGVTGVVLKGAALRETIYEHPVQRHVRDLDVLCPAEDVSGALEALQDAGYQLAVPADEVTWFTEHHFHIEVTHPTGFVVEVHWGLTRPGRPWQLDPARFLDRARSLPLEDAPMAVPSDEDMLIHLAAQGLEDQYRRLRRLVDIDRIVTANPDLDWTYVWSSARDGRLEMVVACALQLCHGLLGTEVPEDFRERLGLSRLAAAHLALLRPDARVLNPDPGSRARRLSVRFWSARRWRDRSRILAAPLVDPSRKIAAIRTGVGRSPGRTMAALWASVRDSASVLLYQTWLYSRGVTTLLRPAAHRPAPFWRPNPTLGHRHMSPLTRLSRP